MNKPAKSPVLSIHCLVTKFFFKLLVTLPFFVLMQNTIIDERGSLAVASPFPGPLAKLLRSIKKVGVDLLCSLCKMLLYTHKNSFPLPPSLLCYFNPVRKLPFKRYHVLLILYPCLYNSK